MESSELDSVERSTLQSQLLGVFIGSNTEATMKEFDLQTRELKVLYLLLHLILNIFD